MKLIKCDAISTNIRRLRTKGFITNKPDSPDPQHPFIEVTQKGEEFLEIIFTMLTDPIFLENSEGVTSGVATEIEKIEKQSVKVQPLILTLEDPPIQISNEIKGDFTIMEEEIESQWGSWGTARSRKKCLEKTKALDLHKVKDEDDLVKSLEGIWGSLFGGIYNIKGKRLEYFGDAIEETASILLTYGKS